MKYIHWFLTLTLLVLAALTTLISCSPDRVEEPEEVEEEWSLTPEPIPEPDWADGVITIVTGTHGTGQNILGALRWAQRGTSRTVRLALNDPGFPVSKTERVIEITVMSLLEAGFEEPVTIEEIRERFRELGYRPLTLEEAVVTRLHFSDQPDMESGSKMSRFHTLLTKESVKWIEKNVGMAPRIFTIYHRRYKNYRIMASLAIGKFETHESFACVKKR